ncbi:MAG TPA: PIN domain-containing protein [Candidatus Thermoplasmatota archaeon]|nr:PIN domain-containing protein [Candidatus Thermoplasmatota archaeon]
MDTTFLIDLMRGRERAVALLEELEKEDEPIALATTTLAEFYRGLATLALSAAEKRRVAEVVKGRPLLPLDAAAAERAGQLDAELWARGEPIDPEDGAVAGIALSRDHVLVTRRAREFGRVEGLRLRTY